MNSTMKVRITMVEVKNKDMSVEGNEKLIKTFEKLVKKSGILNEIRDRRYYKKPSEVKREKLNKAKRQKKEL